MPQPRFIITSLSAALASLPWANCAWAQSATDNVTPILVVGERYGAADAPVETEMDEWEIDDYAADSVGDLIGQISPLIDGTDDPPVLIVNGKRIADPRDIRGYPPEALQRIEILSREAAGRYGYAPDKRVVNLVLKRHYSGLSTEAGVIVPTALGRNSETLGIQRVTISGPSRWNLEVNLKRESMLLESDRNVPPAPGGASIAGNIYALASDLDPRLSALAGTTIAAAAVPAGASAGSLAFSDFLAGAGSPSPRDDAAFRSLAPSTRSLSLNAGVTRPVGPVNLSLNLRAQTQHSRRILGLSPIDLELPASSPFSPFENDISLDRLLVTTGPLSATQDTTSIGLSANALFSLAGMHATLGLVYDHGDAISRTMRGFDLGDVQSRIAGGDPALNPFGSIPVAGPLVDRVRSSSTHWSTDLELNGQPLHLPAGPVQASFTATYDHSAADNRFDNLAGIRRDLSANDSGNARIQLQLSVASRRARVLSRLGELQLTLSGGAEAASGTPLRISEGAGIVWSPFDALNFNLRFSRDDDAPSNDQRNAALVETPGVRIYDYATGELAEVVEVTGGNPDLGRGTRSSLSLGGFVRPLGGRTLMLNLDYQKRISKGGVGALPALTRLVEAAFPDRLVRDTSGQLVRVDLRPINLARESQASLRSGITSMLPLGVSSPSARAMPAREVAQGSGEGARRTAGRTGVRRGMDDGRGRLQLSLNHSWQLENSLLIRTGLPLLDRLRGEGGGQSRHQLRLNAMIARRGAGLSLDVNWQSPYWTRADAGGSSDKDLHFGARFTADLRANFDLGRVGLFGKSSWLRGTRLTLSIDNLFDTRRQVVRADGTVPPGYTRDEIDPIGRTVGFSLRRRF